MPKGSHMTTEGQNDEDADSQEQLGFCCMFDCRRNAGVRKIAARSHIKSRLAFPTAFETPLDTNIYTLVSRPARTIGLLHKTMFRCVRRCPCQAD